MSQKEAQEQLVDSLKKWQKVENASVVSTSRILEKTEHPLLRMVMETIQRDSQNHFHIQQLIIDSLTQKPMTISPEDVAEVWDLIESHLEIEKKTIDLAQEALDSIKGGHLAAQDYLLRYLMKDEEKHNYMLEALEKVKKDIYPYA